MNKDTGYRLEEIFATHAVERLCSELWTKYNLRHLTEETVYKQKRNSTSEIKSKVIENNQNSRNHK